MKYKQPKTRCGYRKVMEALLGRKLKSGETIHHIDGNPLNDSLNNLMLFSSKKEHEQYHYNKLKEEKIKNGKYKYPKKYMQDYYEKNHNKILRRHLFKRIKELKGTLNCSECERTGFKIKNHYPTILDGIKDFGGENNDKIQTSSRLH